MSAEVNASEMIQTIKDRLSVAIKQVQAQSQKLASGNEWDRGYYNGYRQGLDEAVRMLDAAMIEGR